MHCVKDFRRKIFVICISCLLFIGNGYAQNLDTLFVQDWEGGIGSWFASNGVWDAGVATVGPPSAHSGTRVVGTDLNGIYPNNANTRLTSPLISLPNVTGNEQILLKYWQWHNIENGNDQGIVRISTDGVNWVNLSTVEIDGYSPVWSQHVLDVTSYAGSNIRISFLFTSNHSVAYEGWYVDDIVFVKGEVSLKVFEDFESGVQCWGADNGLWEVGDPGGAHSGQYAAGTVLNGNYTNNANTRLISPKITLTPTPGQIPALFFWQWFNIENNNDNGWVQISTDGVNFTTIAGPITGNSQVWSQFAIPDLSAYVDSTVQFAFYLQSNHSVTPQGWFIDDIRIENIQTNPVISVSPGSLNFGSVSIGNNEDRTVAVSNTGNGVLYVTNISINGANAAQFEVSPDTPFSLTAGQSQNLTVTFTPPATGNYSASLDLASNVSNASVSLSGTGFIELPPDTIIVVVDTVTAFPGDTVMVPVSAFFPPDSSFSSMEMDLSGFQDHLELIEIVTENTLTGDAGWTYQVNPTDSLLMLAAAGSTDISSSGVLFYLKLAVPVDAQAGLVPVTPEAAIFNTGNTFVTLISGGVDVGLLPFYGDVDLNTLVQAFDASVILKYLVGEIPLNPQQMLNANVSLDTTISTWDASLILKYVVGLIDTLPYDSVLVASGSISMADTLDANPNELVDVPIWADGLQNINGMEFRIEYDPAQTTIQEIVWPSSFQDTSFKTYNDSANGIFRIAVVSDSLIAHPDTIIVTLRCKMSQDFTETTVSVNRLRLNEDIPTFDVAMTVLKPIVGISDGDQRLPREYALDQNYPNPFNPETAIRYHLPQSEHVKLTVYNMLGQEIRVLVNEPVTAGSYSVRWDGRDAARQTVASGVYIYKMTAGNFIAVQKMLLMQ